jgi:hypothetical protein
MVNLAGCGQDESRRKNRTIKGTAENIDEATGRVAMNWYNRKKQIEMKIEGIVTPQTEILINGRVAQLNEIKVGEPVLVTGYEERDGERRKLVATKIEIERDEWSRGPRTATQAATKPTGKPAA